MLGLFKRRPLVSEEFAGFAFDCFAWLMRNTRPFDAVTLVQPTGEFFPQRGLRGHQFAAAVFESVKQHAGMSQWPCRLEAQEDDPDPKVSRYAYVKNAPVSPLGTFLARPEGIVITYKPSLSDRPMSLVATFAHELAHYLTHGFCEEAPGGKENREFATDIGSVFLGFGLFAVNSSFEFTRIGQGGFTGWSVQRRGYLAEPDLLFALAIFAALRAVPQREILAHLKPALRNSYRRACSDVAAHGDRLDLLRSMRSSLPSPV